MTTRRERLRAWLALRHPTLYYVLYYVHLIKVSEGEE